MCGRFSLNTPISKITSQFNISELQIDIIQSYNIAPGNIIPIVCQIENHKNMLVNVHWGFIPHWTKQDKMNIGIINARADTVAVKPSFRHAFKSHRCLIVADGFYEWQQQGKVKQPYYIKMASGELMGFAGLWDRWVSEDGKTVIESCCIITVGANPLLRTVHDRMPAILPKKDYSAWLDPTQTDASSLHTFLKPFPTSTLQMYPVTTKMNRADYNKLECVKPLNRSS